MSSTHTINFGLRQNKAIERSVAVASLQSALHLMGEDPVYLGLGSVWFQDFRLAHQYLGVQQMVSIEANDVVYERAVFNSPYRVVEVVKGWTNEIIPRLLEREDLADRPWIVWLDYDSPLDEDKIAELRLLIESVAAGSAILTTYNTKPGRYGRDAPERRQAIIDLLDEDMIDADISDEDLEGKRFSETLSTALSEYLQAVAIRAGRAERFVPAISIRYSDSVPMSTVGGLIPDSSRTQEALALVQSPAWFGVEQEMIDSQPLTTQEIYALCRLLPLDGELTREMVRSAGFDLEDRQIRIFQKHYLRYPVYAEVL